VELSKALTVVDKLLCKKLSKLYGANGPPFAEMPRLNGRWASKQTSLVAHQSSHARAVTTTRRNGRVRVSLACPAAAAFLVIMASRLPH